VPIQKAKAKICENSKKPDEFINKYNDLKDKNCRELDPLVYFLAEISDKNEVTYLTIKKFKKSLKTPFKFSDKTIPIRQTKHQLK